MKAAILPDFVSAKVKINTAKQTLFKLFSVLGTNHDIQRPLAERKRLCIAAIDEATNKLNEAREILVSLEE